VSESEDALIAQAMDILARRHAPGTVLSSPGAVKCYLQLRIGRSSREVFGAVYLDSQNRVIEVAELFVGTLSQTGVYPREVVRGALMANAANVILFHNHPSGFSEPSAADVSLTRNLRDALALVDVQVLDHIVVGLADCASLAERGLL
jgi:DNA repair protein RadC